MARFDALNERFRERIEQSFAGQPFLNFIGGELVRVEAGEVDIALPYTASLAQQNGYVHGGVITALADSAAGYAAMTLAPAGSGTLTTELKVNFLRPAGKGRLAARGRVIKPGRSLTVCQCDVFEAGNPGLENGAERHVLTGLVTMMFLRGLEER